MRRGPVIRLIARLSLAYALLAVQALWNPKRSLRQFCESIGEAHRTLSEILAAAKVVCGRCGRVYDTERPDKHECEVCQPSPKAA